MNKDPKFTVIGGGDKPSGENGHEEQVVLGVELIKKFQNLNHANKAKVIEFVDSLASSENTDGS
jgi:hypothetical protein